MKGNRKPRSEETKRKISIANKGRKMSEEHKRKIGLANKGKTLANGRKPTSEEDNKKNSEIHKKIGVPWLVGRKWSEERKKKWSEMFAGDKNPFYGRRHSDATKQKISKNNARLSGENHWNWKGGDRAFKILIRECYKYRQWRSDIFTRDLFTCQWCGANGGHGKAIRLVADHIKAFSLIILENNILSLEEAEACEELWNINNGRTLCAPCHSKTENFGGKVIKYLKRK